jgi:hypothetical protein
LEQPQRDVHVRLFFLNRPERPVAKRASFVLPLEFAVRHNDAFVLIRLYEQLMFGHFPWVPCGERCEILDPGKRVACKQVAPRQARQAHPFIFVILRKSVERVEEIEAVYKEANSRHKK